MESSTHELISQLKKFRDDRDWAKFHTLKNLINSTAIEVAELLELVQWKTDAELNDLIKQPAFKDSLAEEVADVYLYLLLICDKANIDLLEAGHTKIMKNAVRYPVSVSRGNAIKQP